MKYRLMDLLACPICKHFPLSLTVFNTYDIPLPSKIRKCELYCAYHGGFVNDVGETDCRTCYSKEISSGILECPKCGRWFPIEDDIPRMLPDNLRKAEDDISFLIRWKDRIDRRILLEGKPYNLAHIEEKT